MKIDKLNNTYNDYKLEVSFGELTALLNALEASPGNGPIHDEMREAISWYMERIPGPGEDKEEFKAKKAAGDELGHPAGLEQASELDLALPKEKGGPPMEPGAETPAGEPSDVDNILPEPPAE